MPAPAAENLLELIGGTPLVRLRHLGGPEMADVFAKCEQFNPGGSVKDRVALAMIQAAEDAGRLRPGESTIVEPTSGNTGVGLALVCAIKRYRLVLTMPDNMSLERRALLAAYGAEVHLTPADRVMEGAVARANEFCAAHPDAFMPQQFQNLANPGAHYRTTGPEILAQLGNRKPDVLVAGVGTGGTITGVGRAFRERNPDVRIVAVEPRASAVLSGGPVAAHRIDGIGAGFVPDILDRALLSEVRTISEEDAQRCKLELARREGLLVGISAGAAVKIALDVAREVGPERTVVTILPDTGERYFSSDKSFGAERTPPPEVIR